MEVTMGVKSFLKKIKIILSLGPSNSITDGRFLFNLLTLLLYLFSLETMVCYLFNYALGFGGFQTFAIAVMKPLSKSEIN